MAATSNPTDNLAIKLFGDKDEWTAWLAANHDSTRGVWLQLAKKASDLTSLSYSEALDAALCYGWIDGQKRSYDEQSWLQKFTPRGAKSIWSQINRDKAAALIEHGAMQAAGGRAIEQAKADGRWAAAYEAQSKATVPDDLQAALDENPAAQTFFTTLDSRNRYAILFRIQIAKKAATRAKRIQQFVDMLARQEKLYP